jgi:DNA polymerase-3 subunit chi
MTEVMFYHLEQGTVMQALPALLQKCLQKDWRAVVQCASAEQCQALDGALWTYQDDSFLPHIAMPHDRAASQPVILTADNDNPNQAHVRFCLSGVSLPDDPDAYVRIIILFQGDDEQALVSARMQWKNLQASSHQCTYWQQDERGQWRKKR